MASPVFDAALHDVSVNGRGYMTAPEGRIVRQDAVAATTRAAQGEGRYDLYQVDSFFAQATFAGGAGQSRFVAADGYLSGVCDSRWGGHLFPARKLVASANNGGTASFMFHRGSNVYGFASGGDIELFGSNTTYTGLSTLPRNQPVVDGENNMFYVTTDNKLGKFTGTGSVSNITSSLGSGVTPYATIPYHRYLWCIAQREVAATAGIEQSKTGTVASPATAGVTARFTSRPVPGNTLVLFVFTEGSSQTLTMVSEGWELRENYDSSVTGSMAGTIWCLTKEQPTADDQTVRWTHTTGDPISYILLEVEGVDSVSSFVDAAQSSRAGGTAAFTSGTVLDDTGIILFGLMHETSTVTWTEGASYTELIDADAGLFRHALHYRADTTDTSTTSTASSLTGAAAGIILKLKSNAITNNLNQTILFYSDNGGATWTEVFSDTGTGIGTPSGVLAVGGFMWLATDRGLYQIGVEDTIFEDGVTQLNVFMRGPVDTFNAPSNSANAGLWIAHFDGSLFYAVGQTVRSYPIGGIGGRQIWPTPDWGTTGGNIGAVVAGEGGVYFGAGPILWNFNGRGFHPLATNATANIYDYLYWHQGKLYVKSDPASSYDFGYPSLRPDIYATAATNFETGYWISSLLDFDKMDVYKHLAEFQTFAEWSATSNSGTITLEYLSADTGAQPDRLGGGATSLTWVSIGTHTIADGNVKKYSPSVIKAKAIYLRVKIEVGASGYPIVQSVVANGTAIMPPVDRLVIPIMLGTDQRNKAAAQMYLTPSAVWDAKKELRDLRRGTDTVEVKLLDDDGGTSTYTCVVEQFQDSIQRFKKINRAVAGDAQLVVRQVPGTTITETRP